MAAIDLAELGLSVRSDGVVVADKRLVGLTEQAKKTETATNRLVRQTEKANKEFLAMDRILKLATSAFLVYGGARVLGNAINQLRQFETGLVGVVKTTGLAGKELENYSKKIIQLSQRIPVMTTELLSLSQAAGQMGVTGAANLTLFTETVAKLGRASNLAGDTAATALARIINVTGESIDTVDTLASVIVSLGNNIAATESEIAHMTTRIAQATSAFRLNSAQISAMGGALASMGVQAEAGGTAIGQAFNAINNAVAAGGKELKEFADALQLDGKMLSELYKGDKLKGFQFFLEEVGELGDDAGLALENAGIGGIRLAQSIIPLSNNLDILQKTMALANAEVENATALDREFNATLQTLDNRIVLLKNNLAALALAFGGSNSALSGSVDIASDAVKLLIENLRAVLAIMEAIAVVAIVRLISSMVSYAKVQQQSVAVSMAHSAALAENAAITAKKVAGEVALMEVQVASTRATLATIVAERELAAQRLINDRMFAGSFRRAADLNAIRDARLAELAVSRQLTAQELALAQATAASTIAQNGAAVAAGRLSVMNRILTASSKALSSVMSLLGGPTGLFLLASYGVYKYITSIESLEEKQKRLTQAITEQKDALAELTITETIRDAAVTTNRISDLKVELETLEKVKAAYEATNRPQDFYMSGYAEKFENVSIELEALNELFVEQMARIEALRNPTKSLETQIEEMIAAYPELFGSMDRGSVAIEETTDKVREQIIELAKQQSALHMTERQAAIFEEAWAAFANGAGPDAIQQIIAMAGALFDQAEAAEVATQAQEDLRFIDSLEDQKDALKGGAKAWREYEKAMFQSQAVAELGDKATAGQIETVRELAAAIFELQNPIDGLSESLRQVGRDSISALSAMQDMFKDGSKESKVLGVAIQAINVALAIQAILSQASKGDPYTAFARMAAMAAAVIPLVGAIGTSFGGLGDTSGAEQRQASQGTGSLLGDPAKQSESIINAVETTADATSKLVGISTGMLQALRELQAGIAGATTKISGGEQSFTALKGTSTLENALFGTGSFNLFGLNFVGELLKKWFGGKSEIIDEGIVIAAGTMNDLMESTLVGAFQEVKSKKSIFHSTKIKTEVLAFGEEVSAQFALVFESMFNAVTESALALGILDDDITTALDNFRIEEQKISLLGLSGDDRESAIQAVFSKIFDGLATAVIPFIRDFQKVGEGLGETLVRVATNVQVMEEAIIRLGLNAERVSAEQFAQMSVELIELAGGLDQFITSMENFIGKFANDERKFAIVSNDLNRAFERVQLTVPETRAEMFDLVKTLDATTESGRQQIATILRLTDTADAYYDFLEDAEDERLEKEKTRQKKLDEAYENATEQAANLLESITSPIKDLMKTIRDDISSITGVLDDAVASTVAQQITHFEELRRQALANHAEEIRREEELHNTRLRLADSLAQFANNLRIGSLSPLSNRGRFELAQEGFRTTLAAAMGGDVKAAERLQGAAQLYADLSREMFASSMKHVDNMDEILNGLDAASGMLGASTFNPQEANDRLIAELQRINEQLGTLPEGISGELEPLFHLMLVSGLAAGQTLQQIATRINGLLATAGAFAPTTVASSLYGPAVPAGFVPPAGTQSPTTATLTGVDGANWTPVATTPTTTPLDNLPANPYAGFAYTAQDAQNAINAILATATSEYDAVSRAAAVLQDMGFSSALLDQLGIGGSGGASASELLARYGLPAFETGGPIMETGPIVAHRGEHVINAERDNLIVNVQSNTEDISELRDILKEIRDNGKRYQEEDLKELKNIQRTLSTQTEVIRRAS